jgi:hypothetical protein
MKRCVCTEPVLALVSTVINVRVLQKAETVVDSWVALCSAGLRSKDSSPITRRELELASPQLKGL